MSNPSGVDANAAPFNHQVIGCGFSGSVLEVKTKLVVRNDDSSNNGNVNAYVCLDGALIDAIPLTYPPSQTRLEFTSDVFGLASGSHTVDVYLGGSASTLEMIACEVICEVTKT